MVFSILSGQRGGSYQSPDMYQLREGLGRMTEKVIIALSIVCRLLHCLDIVKNRPVSCVRSLVVLHLQHTKVQDLTIFVFLQISNVASGVLSTIQV